MKKNLDIHMTVRMSEMEESFFERFEHTLAPLCQVLRYKGKQKVSYKSASESTSASSDGESDISVTQELNDHTRRLCISDKRKRGPEPVFEDSPPMEQPPKHTPKRGALKPVKLTACITRSKAKFRTPAKSAGRRTPGRKSPVKTPLSKRKSLKSAMKTPLHADPFTPGTRGALERMRYRNKVIEEIKSLDVVELQCLCEEDGL
ncbi:hypothetical protein CBR_g19117 [Chara braunii]|uniref:Uncharacterized protein n=1 Tax=Chara braunii TaxID=69332 RepID=A0A388KXK3_CHABU|nr:hypothetical protein CBR_g19117 [Chara braunii]|eukprot:GBG74712.1 hypothetical protein CBR_g19117 [Chara braunii]